MTSPADLAELSDDRLITSLAELVRRGNRLTAELLEHLAEVEVRGLHLEAACSSMHAYCTRVLGMDDAAAYNRIYVARLARDVPVVLEWLAEGRIHLTGLRLLAPLLKRGNAVELLEAASGKTKREIEELVARRDPKSDVPDRVRKRPTPARRRQACSGTSSAGAMDPGTGRVEPGVPTRDAVADGDGVRGAERGDCAGAAAAAGADSRRGGPGGTKPEPARDITEPRAEDRYKIEFTGDAALVAQLQRVQALMSHRQPGCGFETVIGQALELLEAKLLKQRFGVGAKPRRQRKPGKSETDKAGPRTTTRHVPMQVRREVYARDGLRCAYVDPKTGRRCHQIGVEIQHQRAYALGGEHSVRNNALYCRAHNAHAARKDFGRAHVEAAIESARVRRERKAVRQAPESAMRRDVASEAWWSSPVATQLGLFGS
jgi:hypothetical protein